MKKLGEISEANFVSKIYEDGDGRVYFTADADIDADGANSQHGEQPAYKAHDTGSDYLANGGMKRVAGRVILAHDWGRDIVILGSDGQPKVFADGLIASKTWYKYPGVNSGRPEAYVDSQTIPYIVVPPLIINGVKGIVCGCKARATYKGKSVDCVVADRGQKTKIGEVSIAAATALGIPSSPRNGGTNEPLIDYELWPGTAAAGFELQPA